MLVHAYYDEDPRVRREAETLVRAGWRVHVVGLRRPEDAWHGMLAGVAVTRLDVQRHQGAGVFTYLREYLSFAARASWAAIRIRRRERVALVQVHSLPDFLAFAALPLRLVGTPLILDLHEAMPEFFRSRFPRASNRLVHRLLVLQERLSIWLSSATVSVNEAMRDRLVRLGVRGEKLTVVPNTPALERFDAAEHPTRAFAEDGVIRFVYAGALTPTYELDVAVRALGLLARSRPSLRFAFDVYGRGDSEPTLRGLAAAEGIADRIAFRGRIPIDEVPAAVAAADIGLAPTRRDPFTDLSLSTKVYEYAAMGKPAVATRLPMVEAIFPPDTVKSYEAGDPAALAAAIGELIDDPIDQARRVERTLEVVRAHAWERESATYIALVDRLTAIPVGEPVTALPGR